MGSARLHRPKTSDSVVEHVIAQLFSGRLRAGDRIDLTAVADELGVSRAPVREAMVVLERDGLVDIPFHKGVFVGRFDAEVLREAFELYGMVNALGSARVARRADPAVLAALDLVAAQARDATSVDEWEERAREFRRAVNRASGGPRMRSLLRTFSGLVPAASRLSMPRSVSAERTFLLRENDCLRAGDPHGAAEAVLDHVDLLGRIAVETLRDRGVLAAGPVEEPSGAGRDVVRVLVERDR